MGGYHNTGLCSKFTDHVELLYFLFPASVEFFFLFFSSFFLCGTTRFVIESQL